MELIDYLRMLGRRWRWVVSFTLLGLTLGALWAALTPRVYEASALLFVANSGNADSTGRSRNDLDASRFTLERMESYAALVDSPQVTRAVNDELRLGSRPEDIAGVLSASVVGDTVVLSVTAQGDEPAVTASIANVAAARLGAVIQLVEAPGTGAASPVKVTVTQPATAPGSPISPNTGLALALGLVAGA
ncbi:MAG: Wzz/FepE/Etk N-terminal domain-containing protein, partial [Actinomycetota bacterium]|nr:Wzz/FepE/Etk N-terminal domain-containing protein [Actinomycetota bacterium]